MMCVRGMSCFDNVRSFKLTFIGTLSECRWLFCVLLFELLKQNFSEINNSAFVKH